jgi:hypothetical protein
MARPNQNYVRAGDVVRVQIDLKWANFAYGSNDSTNFKNAVANTSANGGFSVVGFNDSAVSTFTGGTMYIVMCKMWRVCWVVSLQTWAFQFVVHQGRLFHTLKILAA